MKQILIVEDEISYITLLRDQLKKKGYKIIEAYNGEEGLTIATEKKPDLILLDIRMPVVNGLDMLDSLRKTEYGKTANVIVLTNLEPDDKILKKIIEDHPSFYFVKSDIQLTDLIEKINSLLQNPFEHHG